MKKITKKEFLDLYKTNMLIREIAETLGVSSRSVITYADKLGLRRGKGNKTRNRVKIDF